MDYLDLRTYSPRLYYKLENFIVKWALESETFDHLMSRIKEHGKTLEASLKELDASYTLDSAVVSTIASSDGIHAYSTGILGKVEAVFQEKQFMSFREKAISRLASGRKQQCSLDSADKIAANPYYYSDWVDENPSIVVGYIREKMEKGEKKSFLALLHGLHAINFFEKHWDVYRQLAEEEYQNPLGEALLRFVPPEKCFKLGNVKAFIGSLDATKLYMRGYAEFAMMMGRELADEKELLINACQAGDIDAFMFLAQNRPERLPELSSELVIEASKFGRLEMVQLLMDTFEVRRESLDKALQFASRDGYIDLIRKLVEAGAEKSVALIEASKHGRVDVVEILVAEDTEKLAEGKKRALIEASRHGHIDVVEALLVAGAEASIGSGSIYMGDGKYGLALIEASKHCRVDVVRTLLTAGADPCAGGNMPLLFACEYGHVEVVKALLDANVSASAREDAPLSRASGKGHVEVVKILLEAGAGAGALTGKNRALIHACRGGHVDVIVVLLEAGAQADAQESAALIEACKYGHAEVVYMLRGKGAQVDAQKGRALIEASKYGRAEMVSELLAAGIRADVQKSQALIEASRSGYAEIVRTLLAFDAEASARGCQALIEASRGGHAEVVRDLLESYPIAYLQDNEALIVACRGGYVEVVRALFNTSGPANVSARDNLALIEASRCGHIDVVRELLDRGADPLARNSQALEEASRGGHIEVVRMVIRNNPPPPPSSL